MLEGVPTPLVVQVILLINMVEYGCTTLEPNQTFFSAFSTFAAAVDTMGIVDVDNIVVVAVVVADIIVVVVVEVGQE